MNKREFILRNQATTVIVNEKTSYGKANWSVCSREIVSMGLGIYTLWALLTVIISGY
jgi:hypothetical protein